MTCSPGQRGSGIPGIKNLVSLGKSVFVKDTKECHKTICLHVTFFSSWPMQKIGVNKSVSGDFYYKFLQ